MNATRGQRSQVPRTNQVFSGASVSIVLKEDQVTGREVQGVVAELLTRGNHPRGIKVRLTDGRVGRVQKMVTPAGDLLIEESESPSEEFGKGMTKLGLNANPLGLKVPVLQRIQYSDFRNDGYVKPERSEANLEDYVVFKTRGTKLKRRGRGKKADYVAEDDGVEAGGSAMQTATATSSTCPVCEEFEGDEAAVAHHVETHFK